MTLPHTLPFREISTPGKALGEDDGDDESQRMMS